MNPISGTEARLAMQDLEQKMGRVALSIEDENARHSDVTARLEGELNTLRGELAHLHERIATSPTAAPAPAPPPSPEVAAAEAVTGTEATAATTEPETKPADDAAAPTSGA